MDTVSGHRQEPTGRHAGTQLRQRSTGRVIITVGKLTPTLATAIVDAYGKDKVAVQVAPESPL